MTKNGNVSLSAGQVNQTEISQYIEKMIWLFQILLILWNIWLHKRIVQKQRTL